MAGQTTNYLFDYPTSTDYVKDGATAIQTLATDVDTTLFTALGGAYPGLRLVKKQAIGSGVSTVTVTGAFSATYDNYIIVISGGSASTNATGRLQFGSTTTGYFYSLIYSTGGNALTCESNNNFASVNYAFITNTSGLRGNIEVLNPFLSTATTVQAKGLMGETFGYAGQQSGGINNTTSYTAFTVFPSGGTMTGGNIYVYGYGMS